MRVTQSLHLPRPLASLGALSLGVALVLGTAGSAGAASVPSAHLRAGLHHAHRAAARRLPIVPPRQAGHTSPRQADGSLTLTLVSVRVRYLPSHAARRAQASIAALAAAWQRGLFHHSARHPRSWAAPLHPAAQSPASRPAAVVYGDPVHDAIYQASQRWGVSYWYLVRLATCESTLNPGAYNPSGASGLFQFMPSTYYAYAARIGEARSLWNAYGSANVAAYMISVGQAHQWTCAGYI